MWSIEEVFHKIMVKNFFNYIIVKFHRKIPNKFIRFVLVGGLNTSFGLGVYCLMVYFGFSYIWATLISQVLGVLFNFLTTGTLVFEKNEKKLIFRFFASYIITYFVNVGMNRALQITLGLNEYLSGVGAIIVSAVASFFILKYFVYK